MDTNIKGYEFDDAGFRKAVEERWERLLPNNVFHCKLHDTYFSTAGPDGEPCWQCHKEFNQRRYYRHG